MMLARSLPRFLSRVSSRSVVVLLAVMSILAACQGDSPDVAFVERSVEPFGTFAGVDFVRHTGIFEGETSVGSFRMPYEIIVPDDPSLGNGTVLMEPPHFLGRNAGRDGTLGRQLLFGGGYSYATVGFGEYGFNILDPEAVGLEIAGGPVIPAEISDSTGTIDEEILVQFTEALTGEAYPREVLGPVERLYAFGVSQTASVLLELRRALADAGRQDLFDFTLLHVAVWDPPIAIDAAFDRLQGDFEPLEDAGRVIFVESEGDQLASAAEQFRDVVGLPDYRLYEVAGAAHQPTENNPLRHHHVARAMFVAGDRWVRTGDEPPPSTLLEPAPPGQVDPVHGFETGIARNADLNARGGVRLPDLEVGRARFVAMDSSTFFLEDTPQDHVGVARAIGLFGERLPRELTILTGRMVDLACEPAAGNETGPPRFASHSDYVAAFRGQADELQRQGFLLEADASALKERAVASDVGRPGTCAP